MKDFYEHYWEEGEAPPLHDPFTPRRIELLWELIGASAVRCERLLDCGSGAGDVVIAAAQRGIEAVGMELSESAIALARARAPDPVFLQHSADDLPWPVEPGTFDVVTSFEVIEHLLEPRRLLQGAHEVLRTGGYLALSTPYHGVLKNLALVLLAFDSHFDVEGPHIRFFSDRSLKRLLGDTGFAVEKIVHLGRRAGLWADSVVWARKV